MYVTYEVVNAPGLDPTFQIPLVADQGVEGALFHATIEGNGLEGAFGVRDEDVPFVPWVGA